MWTSRAPHWDPSAFGGRLFDGGGYRDPAPGDPDDPEALARREGERSGLLRVGLAAAAPDRWLDWGRDLRPWTPADPRLDRGRDSRPGVAVDPLFLGWDEAMLRAGTDPDDLRLHPGPVPTREVLAVERLDPDTGLWHGGRRGRHGHAGDILLALLYPSGFGTPGLTWQEAFPPAD